LIKYDQLAALLLATSKSLRIPWARLRTFMSSWFSKVIIVNSPFKDFKNTLTGCLSPLDVTI